MPVYNEDGVEVVTSAASGGITVKEVDGTPTVASVTTIRFPNGSLTDDGGGQVTYAASIAVAVIADHKAQNTGGGTFTTGGWRTRDLNTEVSDANALVTISSNLFTPIAGTYLLIARAPAAHDQLTRHRARLYNSTQASQVLIGSTVQMYATTGSNQSDTWVMGSFTANGTDAYSIEHYCTTGVGTPNFGFASNITTEVYTQVTLIKIL